MLQQEARKVVGFPSLEIPCLTEEAPEKPGVVPSNLNYFVILSL